MLIPNIFLFILHAKGGYFVMKKLILVILILAVALPSYALDLSQMKFTGHVRERAYIVSNKDMNDAASDLNRFNVQRVWLGTEGNVAENAFVKIVFENEYAWGKYNSTPANGTTIVYGYVKLSKLFGKELALTIGRQDYKLNANNFVLWDNANGLDGLRLNYKGADFDLDLMTLKAAEIASANGDGDCNDTEFYGLVANYSGVKDWKLQGYMLFEKSRNSLAAKESDLKRFIGIRADGKIDAFGLGAEYINLGGDNGAVTETKYKGSLIFVYGNYEVKDAMGLKLFADYLVASGDKNTTVDKSELFGVSSVDGVIQLPGNTNADNAMDALNVAAGAANVNKRVLGFGASFIPVPGKLTASAKYSLAKKDQPDANGLTATSKKLGSHIDLCAKYDISKGYYLLGTYQVFDPNSEFGKDKCTVGALEFRVDF